MNFWQKDLTVISKPPIPGKLVAVKRTEHDGGSRSARADPVRAHALRRSYANCSLHILYKRQHTVLRVKNEVSSAKLSAPTVAAMSAFG